MEDQAAPSPGWRSVLKASLKQINWREVGFTFAAVWLWVSLLTFVLGLVVEFAGVSATMSDTAVIGVIGTWFVELRGRHRDPSDAVFWQYFFLLVIAAPFIEELFFRVLVCGLAEKHKLKWPLILAGSFVGFGMLHPMGVFSIPLQGVVGLLLARLYLTYKGESLLAAYVSCVAVHAAYNFSVVVWEVFRGLLP